MPVEIIKGDALEMLKGVPDASIQCCVTSPPYFGLRDYGVAGQIGKEGTPELFIENLRQVFSEVRRVLREDGTCWINIGDSYCSTAPGTMGDKLNQRGILSGVSDRRAEGARRLRPETPRGMKPKDLIGIPWMLAFALRADGWYLRQDIIWHKPNPMPESVSDRCTKAHEYIFLLTKSDRYYYNAEAVLEPVSPNTHARLSQKVQDQVGSMRAFGGTKTMHAVGRKFDPGAGNKNNPSFDAAMAIMPQLRNKRSVWSVPTKPFKGAHFATFPPALVRPCILAGSRPGDMVLDPFGGAGTTGLVAQELGRNATLIELNPEYADMARARIDSETPGLGL